MYDNIEYITNKPDRVTIVIVRLLLILPCMKCQGRLRRIEIWLKRLWLGGKLIHLRMRFYGSW